MSESENSTAQLTIFYAGVINVFDNVSFDKAQAIMLLAGENSLSKPAVTEIPKGEVKSPPHQSSLTPVRKLKAGLPVARRYSLQCFLEKRRKRIVNKSPYAPLNPKDKKDNETMMNKAINKNHSDSLSPFPARLTCFVPISANNNF
ncbi:Tify [Quillaja saponaria]|uniref:Protein TIFY n=1 Tax=Quillaja saponaria TaxID=32244 RepID=A0AAD7M125_QUISA|nr:Tify [Quillaja saponaria]KAJ7968004.1 Tify [Quillaja saponaria]